MTQKKTLSAVFAPALATVFASLLAACGDPVVTGTNKVCVLEETKITAATSLPTSGCGSYEISKVIEVSAALTIAPGTTLKFANTAGLQILETGSLNATGTKEKPITFTGITQTKGAWKGLAFRSNDPANKLIYTNVSFAGGGEFCCDYFSPGEFGAAVNLGGATMDSPVQVTIANSTISNSGAYGLYLFDTGTLPGFSSNTFKSNALAPVSVPISRVGVLDSASIYSGGADVNVEQFVRVNDIDVNNKAATNITQTMRKLDLPYRISAGAADVQLEYRGALTINAGAILEFEANSGLQITRTGSITVSGTATDRVLFKGRLNTPGFWRGINVLSVGNTMSYATIRDAGSSKFDGADNGAKAGITIGGGFQTEVSSIAMGNSIVATSVYGVYKHADATFADNGGNDFTGNTTPKNF
jgi:hypothetical protein